MLKTLIEFILFAFFVLTDLVDGVFFALFAVSFHFLWDVDLKELKTTKEKLLPLYIFLILISKIVFKII